MRNIFSYTLLKKQCIKLTSRDLLLEGLPCIELFLDCLPQNISWGQVFFTARRNMKHPEARVFQLLFWETSTRRQHFSMLLLDSKSLEKAALLACRLECKVPGFVSHYFSPFSKLNHAAISNKYFPWKRNTSLYKQVKAVSVKVSQLKGREGQSLIPLGWYSPGLTGNKAFQAQHRAWIRMEPEATGAADLPQL